MEYPHLPLNEPVNCRCAEYWVSEEGRMPYKGRQVLYVIRDTSCITSCCGLNPGFRSVLVPGFVERWKYKTNENGYVISEVESIADEQAEKELGSILLKQYNAQQIEFW